MTDRPGDHNQGAPELAAGDFSTWLTEMQRALRGERSSDVPCGTCTACCTAAQFIHIAPDETDTLAHIPAELLFPAPRLPPGNVLLGYNQHGHCPMLIDNRCSIYEHRPRTCRTYDCRVFPAAGLDLATDEDGTKVLIAQQARRWRFTTPTSTDRAELEAVRTAATYLQQNSAVLPPDLVPTNATQLAVAAVEVHRAFLLRHADTQELNVFPPAPDAVRVELARQLKSGGRWSSSSVAP